MNVEKLRAGYITAMFKAKKYNTINEFYRTTGNTIALEVNILLCDRKLS